MGVQPGNMSAPVAEMDRFFQADVPDVSAWEEMAQKWRGEVARVDALVNNAAVMVGQPGSGNDTPAVGGGVVGELPRSILPCVSWPRGGAVVNVSPVHAIATSANIPAYGGSNGGMSAGSRRLAIALAGDIIRVDASINSFTAGGGGKVRSRD
ncbi:MULTISPECIES: alcohol dehydrogenase [Limnospira]|uniref:Alcohol dehydrogenase n=1 Tax=Limnospira fusiformis PMC 851.14 TaxID=2219512 RepID=A0ABU9EST1_LIMFS|nr:MULTISPECIES: alcohol dehydrogenase [unclassified Limnospira]